jgi:hypothetical protein
MTAETLTPELEISAARMDLWCAKSVLANVAYWMRVHAGVPQSASVWYAYLFLQQRAAKGDLTAARKLTEFHKAATACEGARVVLAGLTR